MVCHDGFRRGHLFIVVPHFTPVQMNPEYQMPGLDLIPLA